MVREREREKDKEEKRDDIRYIYLKFVNSLFITGTCNCEAGWWGDFCDKSELL